MIVASFGGYVGETVHDHETPLRAKGSALSEWAGVAAVGLVCLVERERRLCGAFFLASQARRS